MELLAHLDGPQSTAASQALMAVALARQGKLDEARQLASPFRMHRRMIRARSTWWLACMR